jgi:hypothetical protein
MRSILSVVGAWPQVIKGVIVSLYGDGHTGEFIVKTLLNIFSEEG